MCQLHEECGIVALYHLPNVEKSSLCPFDNWNDVSRLVPRMLLDLQHRGQISAGMTTYHPDRQQLLATHKDVGTVAEVFRRSRPQEYNEIMDELAGPVAIGHVRYATSGKDDSRCAHPFERPHIKRHKWFSFAFNGQLTNYETLKDEFLSQYENAHFVLDSDSEILERLLCTAVSNERDLVNVCKKTTEKLDGAFSLVFVNALGEMFVARGPHGIKPLCYAFDGSLFAAASESVSLLNIGFSPEQIKDVEPGHMLVVTPEGVREAEYMTSGRTAHCFFEWIYFANPASVIDGKSVYLARKRLGEVLAEDEVYLDKNGKEVAIAGKSFFDKREEFIVVPVPDTSKAAADGMAYALGVPCQEGLMRNRYSGRTFIEAGESRRRRAESKYTPIPEVLAGKRVFLVEDSIVRSTTMRVLIQRLREVGHVKEIHVRVSCPPVVAPCFYGTDMSTYGELFAPSFMMEHYGPKAADSSQDGLSTLWKTTAEIEAEMAEDIGCDSLHFLSIGSLERVIGISHMYLCEACVCHDYPSNAGWKLAQGALINFAEDYRVKHPNWKFAPLVDELKVIEE